jgi:hypothetical protein
MTDTVKELVEEVLPLYRQGLYCDCQEKLAQAIRQGKLVIPRREDAEKIAALEAENESLNRKLRDALDCIGKDNEAWGAGCDHMAKRLEAEIKAKDERIKELERTRDVWKEELQKNNPSRQEKV